MPDTPASSTVRNALAVVAAVDDLLRPGREGRVLDADTAVNSVVAIIEECRDLRAHQARDVIDHLHSRCAEGALSPPAQTLTGSPGDAVISHNTAGSIRLDALDTDFWKGVSEPAETVANTPARLEDGGHLVDAGGLCMRCGAAWPYDEACPDADGERAEDPAQQTPPDPDPLDESGRPARAAAAVDELAARVNKAPDPQP